jgi:ribosomal protein L34
MSQYSIAWVESRCDVTGDCWEWKSEARTAHAKRHPLIRINGQPTLMRRHAYEQVHGELPEDRYLVPHCGNSACIAPDHQRVISQKQRNKLGGRVASHSPTRGRKVSQSRRAAGRTKLDEQKVMEILTTNESAVSMGMRMGVHPSRITQVRRGEGWKDYTNPFAGLGARA